MEKRVKLWDTVDPKMSGLARTVDQALKSRDEHVRVFGAMLLSKIEDRVAFRERLSIAVRDKSNEVRRIAWLNNLERGNDLVPDELGALLLEDDIILKSIGVLSLDDNSRLSKLVVTAKSHFVQAVAVRKLSRVWPKKGDAVIVAKAALEWALLSDDVLLRSCALYSARRLQYHPVPILRGMTFDGRPVFEFDYLLDISPGARRKRQEYGLSPDYEWSLALLRMAIIRAGLIPSVPPERTSFLLPLDEPVVRIGALAAEALIRSKDDESRKFVRWAADLPLNSRLVLQLKSILEEE
jgi:hypothetical protein